MGLPVRHKVFLMFAGRDEAMESGAAVVAILAGYVLSGILILSGEPGVFSIAIALAAAATAGIGIVLVLQLGAIADRLEEIAAMMEYVYFEDAIPPEENRK